MSALGQKRTLAAHLITRRRGRHADVLSRVEPADEAAQLEG